MGGRVITEGGRELVFTVGAQRTTEDAIRAQLELREGSSDLLRITVELAASGERVAQTADGSGFSLQWTMDLAGGHASLSPVTGRVNGRAIDGDYNHLDKTTTANVALDHWLPKSIKWRISSLGPLFRSLSIEMARAQYDPLRPPGSESAWKPGDRDTLWESARAGVAVSSTVSGGIGSLAGGFLFGFAASLDAESCLPALWSAS